MTTPQLDADIRLRFAIFRKDTRFIWANHFRYAQEQRLYPPELAHRYIEALTLLHQLLGESFLRQVRHTHPLANMILDAAPWQVHRICHYADQLHYLAGNDPHFPAFRQKLLSPADTRQEILPFLHISHLLRSAGMEIRFPAAKTGQKNPDIVITDPQTGQIVYGEVSKLGKSKDRHDSEVNYNKLCRTMASCLTNPLYSAIQLQPVTDTYLATLGPILTALQQQVADTNLPAEHSDPYLTIKLFPISQQQALYDWMATANRRKDLNGPHLDVDETQRISNNKVLRKSKQLLPGTPGILFLPLESIHFWQQKVTETIAILQQRMRTRPHVLGIFLFAEILHVDAEHFRFNPDDGFDRSPIADPLVRYSLFVPNRAFCQPIHPETRKKLLAALAPRLCHH
jgi:hypothetical protein